MCLMITKPAAARIKKEYLEGAFTRNGDGAGIAVAHGHRVKVIRPLWTFAAFYKAYKRFEQYPLLIHFRLATHGSKCQANTHPHIITNDLAMAHNGVISKVKCEGDESDTRAFLRLHVDPIVKEAGPQSTWAVTSDANLKKFDGEIGLSKLAFLNNWGHFWYVNKQMGHEHEGCWYSNHTYKQNRPVTTTYTTHGQSYHYEYNDSWKLAMVYCCNCKKGHQNRNTNAFYLGPMGMSAMGHNGHKLGMSVYVCRKCLASHGHAWHASGYQTWGVKPADGLQPAIKSYLDRMSAQDTFAKTDREMAGQNLHGTKGCSACGLYLPTHCHQPYLDPTYQAGKVVRYLCRICIADLKQEFYEPDCELPIQLDDPIWVKVKHAEAYAKAAYEKFNAPPVKVPQFPAWIETAKNLLAKPPQVQRQTQNVTLVSGWCCEMCGEQRMTLKHADGTRMCTMCNEDYLAANCSWAQASILMAKRLNITLSDDYRVILPPEVPA